MKRPKVFIVCSGLGRINRGYESFFRGCFDELVDELQIDLALFKGTGARGRREFPLWNLPRNSRSARRLGKLVGRSGYFVEQFTFFLNLLPHLAAKRPDVVYVSDVSLANLLRLAKRCLRCEYNVLFNNNGPVVPRLLHRWDHIQQVSPQHLEQALATGVPEERQTLLPSAVTIPRAFQPCDSVERTTLREQLGLPRNRPVVLSVGAIDGGRKRMDYVVREVAGLPTPRPFLLLLGQRTSDSSRIISLARQLLSDDGFDARTVAREEVGRFYRAADLFVLASLDEGFGLAYAEAMSHGLPCLVHDHQTARFVLGDAGHYADLSRDGGLCGLMNTVLPDSGSAAAARLSHARAFESFSWAQLKPQYVDLFCRCASGSRRLSRERDGQ